MRTFYFYILIHFLFCCCSNNEEADHSAQGDTKPPQITLNGPEVDTAYLNTVYKDKSAALLDEIRGELRCMDKSTHLETTGYVDTRIKGTYTLSYIGYDNAGNASARLTRTVHVVPNTVDYLCGNYIVNYTCTAYTRGVEGSTVSTGMYKATVAPGAHNDHFELASLHTGPMHKVLNGSLKGEKLIVDYWDSDYAKTDAVGFVAKDKNSFTIEATTFLYTRQYYKVINVYTRQLIIKTLSQK